MKRILVVEDESNIALGFKAVLTADGHDVELASDGQTALDRAHSEHFDLILLDIMLPDIDGYKVCGELRRVGDRTPILMLTAKGTEGDKITGLNLGADDYAAKPIGSEELRARVSVLLRRTAGEVAELYCFGDVEVDFTKAEVRRKNHPIQLTPIEIQLLFLFVRRRGCILTRDQLIDELHSRGVNVVDRTIKSDIKNLQRQIEPDPRQPVYLVSVRELGYRFNA